MCTRVNCIVDQLECYMDDMVDCFEEFVKKSMLVISVAVGTLVLMVMYVLKLMSERAASRAINFDTTADTVCKYCQVSRQNLTHSESTAYVENLRTNTKSHINTNLPNCAKGSRTISSQINPNPSADDNITKEVEVCIISKPCETCKQVQVSDDLKSAKIEYKLSTTTRQPSIPKSECKVKKYNKNPKNLDTKRCEKQNSTDLYKRWQEGIDKIMSSPVYFST